MHHIIVGDYIQRIRDLTEQAANKMKYLSFSKDPNEDYWVNELITERLKLNITQVCASNNITNSNRNAHKDRG